MFFYGYAYYSYIRKKVANLTFKTKKFAEFCFFAKSANFHRVVTITKHHRIDNATIFSNSKFGAVITYVISSCDITP